MAAPISARAHHQQALHHTKGRNHKPLSAGHLAAGYRRIVAKHTRVIRATMRWCEAREATLPQTVHESEVRNLPLHHPLPHADCISHFRIGSDEIFLERSSMTRESLIRPHQGR